MLLRLVIFTIIYILFIVIGIIIPSQYYRLVWCGLCNYVGMSLTGFRMNVVNHQRVYDAINSNDNILIVANHRTLFDPYIISGCLNGHISHVFDRKILDKIPFFTFALQYLTNSIPVEKKNTTELIKKFVEKRKKGDPLMCIFADAMGKIEKNKHIAPFKTGAFIHKFKILPIIVKYKNYIIDPTHLWYKDEHFIWGVFKTWLNDTIDVTLHVMEPITPKSDWTIDYYKNYVHYCMNKQYEKM